MEGHMYPHLCQCAPPCIPSYTQMHSLASMNGYYSGKVHTFICINYTFHPLPLSEENLEKKLLTSKYLPLWCSHSWLALLWEALSTSPNPFSIPMVFIKKIYMIGMEEPFTETISIRSKLTLKITLLPCDSAHENNPPNWYFNPLPLCMWKYNWSHTQKKSLTDAVWNHSKVHRRLSTIIICLHSVSNKFRLKAEYEI